MAPQNSDNQDQADGPDAGAPIEASTGVGAMLMATRLRIGEDLRDVAKTLHIRFIYLQAIEAGRYEDLPGAAYALGFIRSYADYLGLDIDEVVRRFKKEATTQKSETSKLIFPVPIPESSVPGGAIVFIGFALAILAYGGWYVSTAKDGFLAELISPLPERLSALLPDDEKGESAPEETVNEPEQAAAQVSETAPETAEAVVETVEEVVEPVEKTVETVEKAVEPVEKVVEPVEKVVEPVEKAVEPVQPTAEPVIEPERKTIVSEESVAQPVSPAPVAEMVAQPSAQLAEPVADFTQPAPNTPAAAAETVTKVVETAPVTPAKIVKPGPTSAAMSDAPATNAPATEVASQPSSESQGRVYGVEDNTFRIEVKARKNSWIQVRDDAANTLILTRLLRVGDSYRVPDRQGLKLLTGNAGALEILVDGKAVPPIGSSGAVRRSVALDPDRLVQGQAVE